MVWRTEIAAGPLVSSEHGEARQPILGVGLLLAEDFPASKRHRKTTRADTIRQVDSWMQGVVLLTSAGPLAL